MQYVKYPRTFHLPYSPGASSDDKILNDDAHFIGNEVIVTQKMDGECTTMYARHIHARSIDSANHPSRNWVKNFHGTLQYTIPESYRICGENLFARHSIEYTDLSSYFYAFSVWDNTTCLDWDSTVDFLNERNIDSVNVLYRGIYDRHLIETLALSLDTSKVEGFVIRLTSSFEYDNFSRSVAKWVRPNHVTTDSHWMNSSLVKNKLKDE